ncbi:MAG: type IV toxin-antitoxin system AbiEi family antitoxin domain-containing protein [Myxococcaceae bacterium]
MQVIPKVLRSSNFSRSEAERSGISRYRLYRCLEEGVLERLERGIYRVPRADYNDEDTFRTATLCAGKKSAVCLLSALVFYNLTDEIPRQTWLMVEQAKRSKHKNLHLIRVAEPKWKIGIDSQKGYQITSLERTLVDCLIWKRHLGTMLGIQSMKRALEHKKTSLSKIIDMANRLGVLERIQVVIEVLAS